MNRVYQNGRGMTSGMARPAVPPPAPLGWNETLERASELGVELIERTAAGERTDGAERSAEADACRGLPLSLNHAPESALRDLRLTQRLADLRREERARGHRSETASHEETAFW